MSAKYKNGTSSQAISSVPSVVHGIIVNSHTSGTFRFTDGASGTVSAGVKATQVLTGSDVFSDGETITVDETVYTMKTTLTNLVANEVLIGANLATSLDNLKLAINAGAGAGTVYSTGTVAHPTVTATTNTDTAQTVEAIRIGTAGNAIVTTETCANASWGAGTLASGAEASLAVTTTWTLSAGPQSIMFPAGIDFNSAVYLTIGGTIDYTVLYTPSA
jgi:hypothetical protein